MLINSLPPVDPTPVLDSYNSKGLDISKLERCNSQEFRYINGPGEGYFLMTANITTEYLTLDADREVSLKILDRLSILHPAQTGLNLYIYHTAEPKYKLYQDKVERNYNVTIRKSLTLESDPLFQILPPDAEAPLTLQEVIEDFIPSGYTLNYYTDEIISYDIGIEGLSVGDAIDHLCSIYGLGWTATLDEVYIFDFKGEENSSSVIDQILPGFEDPIKDINHTKTNPNLSTVNVTFPVYDWVRTTPKEYITVESQSDIQGKIINCQDPYLFAILDSLEAARNQSELNDRATLIEENLQAIASTINFLEYNYYNLPGLGTPPHSLSEIVGDIGEGPFTIYRQLKYPYLPIQPKVASDRLANNWIGTITDGYYGQVASFIVTPQTALDGKLPPGPQRVHNKYRWNYGEEGWKVRVEWSAFEGIWIALQQEYDCPPEEAPPPVEEPTTPVNPWPE